MRIFPIWGMDVLVATSDGIKQPREKTKTCPQRNAVEPMEDENNAHVCFPKLATSTTTSKVKRSPKRMKIHRGSFHRTLNILGGRGMTCSACSQTCGSYDFR